MVISSLLPGFFSSSLMVAEFDPWGESSGDFFS